MLPCFRGLFVAQVEHIGAGNRRARDRRADHRRVPFGSGRHQEPEHRFGHRVLNRANRPLEQRLPALQGVEHREHREDRVLGLPRLRDGAKHEVFKGRGAERAEAGVDAFGVGVKDAAVRGLGELERAMRDIAEAMQARFFVHFECPDAHQARQLTGRLAPLQIHLEKAILRVQEAEGSRDVLAGFGGDGWHAERIALDSYRRRQAGDRRRTVDQGKAGAELGSCVKRAAHDKACHDGQQDQCVTSEPFHPPILPFDSRPARPCQTLAQGRLKPQALNIHSDRKRRIAALRTAGVSWAS